MHFVKDTIALATTYASVILALYVLVRHDISICMCFIAYSRSLLHVALSLNLADEST